MCKKLFLILFLQGAMGLPGQQWVSPFTPLVRTLLVLDFQIASPKGNNSPRDFFNYSESIFSWKLSALYPTIAGFSLSRMTYYQVSYRQINTADKGRKKRKRKTHEEELQMIRDSAFLWKDKQSNELNSYCEYMNKPQFKRQTDKQTGDLSRDSKSGQWSHLPPGQPTPRAPPSSPSRSPETQKSSTWT